MLTTEGLGITSNYVTLSLCLWEHKRDLVQSQSKGNLKIWQN